MQTAIAVVAAVLAGMCLAAGGVLQQREASRRPRRERAWGLVNALLHDPRWLLGIGLAVASYGFQALALTFGALALVQPLIVSELLFALPFSVRAHGLRLGRREWGGAAAVITGLVVGISVASPHGDRTLQPLVTWLPALLGSAVGAAALFLLAGRLRGPATASALALGGALLMGVQSALYKATIVEVEASPARTFLHWEPYALVLFSLAGALLIQESFRAGPLAASSPVIDATLPVVAVVLGIVVFHEHVTSSPAGIAGGLVGVALLLTGILLLDTSPLVRREQRLEAQDAERLQHRSA